MGYLGLVGGADPCANQIESSYAARPIAFRASPYGISHDFIDPRTFVPYLIDPLTLEIEWREDLLITGFDNALGYVCSLDDSTMIWHQVGPSSPPGPYTSRLRVLTRSGLSIAMSGEQQSVTVALPEASVIFLDSSHILRRYTTPAGVGFGHDVVVQVFSVSGSTISLVASTTYPANNYTVTRDPSDGGPSTVQIGSSLVPRHWDGSSTLYCEGFAAGPFGPARIHAVPFSIGGSVTPPDLSWRSRDAQNVEVFSVNTVGSSESAGSGPSMDGFADTGSQMNVAASGFIVAGYAELDQESQFGNYLTPNIAEEPPGVTVDRGPALVSQSGTSLSYTEVEIIARCPSITGTWIAGSHGPTRHDAALGAVSDHLSGPPYRLWAFRW